MRTSRRGFLKTLGGVALFSIVPGHVLGNGYIAPSDQLTKGIIGTGGMGRGHVNYAGTRLVAVCDVDKNHLELGKKLLILCTSPLHLIGMVSCLSRPLKPGKTSGVKSR